MWVVFGLIAAFALLMAVLCLIWALTFWQTWVGLFVLSLVFNIVNRKRVPT